MQNQLGPFTNFVDDFLSKNQYHEVYIQGDMYKAMELSESVNPTDTVALFNLYLEF